MTFFLFFHVSLPGKSQDVDISTLAMAFTLANPDVPTTLVRISSRAAAGGRQLRCPRVTRRPCVFICDPLPFALSPLRRVIFSLFSPSLSPSLLRGSTGAHFRCFDTPPPHTHTPFSLLSWTIPQVSTASLKRMKANIASCSYKLTAKEQAVSDHVMETFFKPLEGNEHCKDHT